MTTGTYWHVDTIYEIVKLARYNLCETLTDERRAGLELLEFVGHTEEFLQALASVHLRNYHRTGAHGPSRETSDAWATWCGSGDQYKRSWLTPLTRKAIETVDLVAALAVVDAAQTIMPYAERELPSIPEDRSTGEAVYLPAEHIVRNAPNRIY